MTSDRVVPASFAEFFDRNGERLAHSIREDAAFAMPQLLKFAETLRMDQVECNSGLVPVNFAGGKTARLQTTPADALRLIEKKCAWIAFKQVEKSAIFAGHVERALASLADAHGQIPDRIFDMHATLIVSATGAVTPYHMDPEHGLLLQVWGEKEVFVTPRTVLHEDDMERFYRDNFRNLHFDPAVEQQSRAFRMQPGEGTYIPVASPHWVRVIAGPSVSLSIIFKSEAAVRREHLYRINAYLRRLGWNPEPVGVDPEADERKLAVYRGVLSVGKILRAG